MDSRSRILAGAVVLHASGNSGLGSPSWQNSDEQEKGRRGTARRESGSSLTQLGDCQVSVSMKKNYREQSVNERIILYRVGRAQTCPLRVGRTRVAIGPGAAPPPPYKTFDTRLHLILFPSTTFHILLLPPSSHRSNILSRTALCARFDCFSVGQGLVCWGPADVL
jgi:hypothetical protein